MAEVRVSFSADIRNLQKGVKDAQKEIASMAVSARLASAGLGATSEKVERIKKEAREAIERSREFRASLEDVGSEAQSLSGILKGGVGIGALLVLASELRDRLVDAFQAGEKAASEARTEFSSLFSQVADFSQLKGDQFVFGSRDDILSQARLIQGEIARIESNIEQLGGSADQAEGLFGIDAQGVDNLRRFVGGFFSDAQKGRNRLIDAAKVERGALEGQLDTLTKQLDAYDKRTKLAAGLSGSELQTRQEIEKQEEALKKAAEAAEELAAIRARIFAVEGTRPIGSRGVVRERNRRIAAGVPDAVVNPGDIAQDARFEEAAKEAADYAFALRDLSRVIDAGLIGSSDALNERIDIMRARLVQLAEQGFSNTDMFRQMKAEMDGLVVQQEALTEQTGLGSDVFTQFGVEGVAALTDIALGFERLEDLGNIVSNVVKGLVRDLALAAAKAALINILFPGAGAAAGGFKGLFKNFLGIPALASGGIVNRPTLSLIGEAGPEAVVPLSKLSSVGGGRVQVEPFSVTVRGGDLVLAFQQARQQTARTVGNIPLK